MPQPIVNVEPATAHDLQAAGEDVVVVCRSGNRSGKAAVILAEAGINARNLNGGMQAWAALGLPVVTFDGTPGDVK